MNQSFSNVIITAYNIILFQLNRAQQLPTANWLTLWQHFLLTSPKAWWEHWWQKHFHPKWKFYTIHYGLVHPKQTLVLFRSGRLGCSETCQSCQKCDLYNKCIGNTRSFCNHSNTLAHQHVIDEGFPLWCSVLVQFIKVGDVMMYKHLWYRTPLVPCLYLFIVELQSTNTKNTHNQLCLELFENLNKHLGSRMTFWHSPEFDFLLSV